MPRSAIGAWNAAERSWRHFNRVMTEACGPEYRQVEEEDIPSLLEKGQELYAYYRGRAYRIMDIRVLKRKDRSGKEFLQKQVKIILRSGEARWIPRSRSRRSVEVYSSVEKAP